jgi:dienelactone hydrolase
MKTLAALCCLMFAASLSSAIDLVSEEIRYEHEGVQLKGVLVYDRDRAGTLPGVLVVHEWWGLNEYAIKRANMLAKLGYVAFACDMYGIETPVTTAPEAQALATPFYADAELFRGRVTAGYTELRKHPKVDLNRTGAIGYCFGGTAVLELARSGAPVSAVVSFHGGLGTLQPAEADAVSANVLVCNGAVDPFVPAEERRAFMAEMEAAGVDYVFAEFAGAVHSFTSQDADGYNIPGAAYDEAADKRSWWMMKSWFAEAFAD